MCESDVILWKEYKKLYEEYKEKYEECQKEIKSLEDDVMMMAEDERKNLNKIQKIENGANFFQRLKFLLTSRL